MNHLVSIFFQHRLDSRAAYILPFSCIAGITGGQNRCTHGSLHHVYLVPFGNDAALQYFCENAFSRHNTVAHNLVDLAAAVALLPDLGYLQKHVAALQSRAHGQVL